MRLFILILLACLSGCQSVQTVVVLEPNGSKMPKVKVEFRQP